MQDSTCEGNYDLPTIHPFSRLSHSDTLPSQCDETKPTCQRCKKAQRVCLWAPSEQARFSIHLENRYASGQTKRPRGPRRALSTTSTSRTCSTGTNTNTLLPREPRLDLQTRAVLHYLHHQVQTRAEAPSLAKTLYDCVSSRTGQSEMVDLAISSIALAVYSHTQHHPPAATQATVQYQHLLRVVRSTLPRLDRYNINACLLAICLMGRYEDTVSRPDSIASCPSFSHHDGALAVLRIWRDLQKRLLSCQEMMTMEVGVPDIVKQTRRGLIRSAMLRNLSFPGWISDGSVFGESGRELVYDSILVDLTNLRHRLGNVETGSTTDYYSELEKMNYQAVDLDLTLQRWSNQFPSAWNYERCWLDGAERDRLPDHFYSDAAAAASASPVYVYAYTSAVYAAVWLQYFSTRMLLGSTRLRILRLLIQACRVGAVQEGDQDPLHVSTMAERYGQEYRECLAQLKSAADGLAASIPSCLGRVKLKTERQGQPRPRKQTASPVNATGTRSTGTKDSELGICHGQDEGLYTSGSTSSITTTGTSRTAGSGSGSGPAFSQTESSTSTPPESAARHPSTPSTSSISPISTSLAPPSSSTSSSCSPSSAYLNSGPATLPIASHQLPDSTATAPESETTPASSAMAIPIPNEININPYLASLAVWPLSIASGIDMNMNFNMEPNRPTSPAGLGGLGTCGDNIVDQSNTIPITISTTTITGSGGNTGSFNTHTTLSSSTREQEDPKREDCLDSSDWSTSIQAELANMQTWFRAELGRLGRVIGTRVVEGAQVNGEWWVRL
ncbi:hypothetical protein A1O1_01993 [Capronia coronata CBS 617.96]|uniref:Zn(2)-C6 fungal-type domain-containing protein n=1 Tax=Capronia coronata CBS 617.96 TaxID=1182541 RepID=W9YWE8_9EURO|nr:uncharacterized protein A1O1_01993 [Capronia coronata CBS 617.96]EXJ93601.1 hypothetical protein A1O1_01993 [Capronia coronata CBS 617.96]